MSAACANTPIITFVNKFDREVREPFELLSRDRGRAQDRVRPDHLAAGHGQDLSRGFHLLGDQLLPSPRARRSAATAEIVKGPTTRRWTPSSR